MKHHSSDSPFACALRTFTGAVPRRCRKSAPIDVGRYKYANHASLTLAALLLTVSLHPLALVAASPLCTFTNPAPAADDYFGGRVAAVGSEAVLVGAQSAPMGAPGAGAAYLFSTNGTLMTAFTNPTPANNEGFGGAVMAVGNDRVLVGAHHDNTGANWAGAAYLFATNGTLLTTFTNPIPANGGAFGYSVAAVGSDHVLIGALEASPAGAAYLLTTNGTLVTTFTNPIATRYGWFGYSVAAAGNSCVLIGSPMASWGALTYPGAAYLFSTNGTLITSFINPTPENYEEFGTSVAAMGSDRVLVGSPSDNAGAYAAGAAYLFSTNGTLLTTFRNPTPEFGDEFGRSVAAVGTDRVLIGAWWDGDGGGAAYLFSTDGTLLTTFTNPSPAGTLFGMAVAEMGSDRLLIGAAGVAYLFNLEAETDAVTAPGRGITGFVVGSVGFSFTPITNLAVTRVGYVYLTGVNPVIKFWANTNYPIATYSLLPGIEPDDMVYTNASLTLLAGHAYSITLQEGPEATNVVLFHTHPEYGHTFQVAPELIYHGGSVNPYGAFGALETNGYAGGPTFSFRVQSTPIASPSLNLSRSNASAAVISWPESPAGFLLEQAAGLPATKWALATNAISVVNATNRVVISPLPTNQFYRLMHP